MSRVDRLFGEEGVRAIVRDFVGRCHDDVMIGFLFKRADRGELERREAELLLAHLGADVVYGGRSLAEAHARHRILGGQFDRRRTLFSETLRDHGVDDETREALLAWQDGLRPLVTADADGKGCLPSADEGATR